MLTSKAASMCAFLTLLWHFVRFCWRVKPLVLRVEAAKVLIFLQTGSRSAKVVLSYVSEDKDIAQRISKKLRENGIDTLVDEGEIRSGDGILRRNSDKLKNCTHFLLIFSPTNLKWLNVEVDGNFIKNIRRQARFIPLLYNLRPEQVSPLVSNIFWLPLDDSLDEARRLIDQIHGGRQAKHVVIRYCLIGFLVLYCLTDFLQEGTQFSRWDLLVI